MARGLSPGRLQVVRDGRSICSINGEIEINSALARIVEDGAVGQLVGFEDRLVLLRTIFDLENAPLCESHRGHLTVPTEQNCIPLHLYAHTEARILP